MDMNGVAEILRALSPFLTAIVVAVASLYSVRMGNRLGSDRDIRSKELETSFKRKQRWEEFEEKTLIECQDEAARFRHVLAKMSGNMTVMPLLTDAEKRQAAQGDVADYAKAESVLLNLISRIRDDETRAIAGEFYKAGWEVRHSIAGSFRDAVMGTLKDQESLRIKSEAMTTKYLALTKIIGEKIRASIIKELGPTTQQSPESPPPV